MAAPVALDPADPWAPEVMRRFLDRLHDLSAWEAEVSYHDGYAAGYAAANAEVVAVLRFALGGPNAATWKQAVGNHHRAITARQLRAEADRPRLRPGDHLGGSVRWEPVEEVRG